LLRTAGHDASHITDYGLEVAPDGEVMARARTVVREYTSLPALEILSP